MNNKNLCAIVSVGLGLTGFAFISSIIYEGNFNRRQNLYTVFDETAPLFKVNELENRFSNDTNPQIKVIVGEDLEMNELCDDYIFNCDRYRPGPIEHISGLDKVTLSLEHYGVDSFMLECDILNPKNNVYDGCSAIQINSLSDDLVDFSINFMSEGNLDYGVYSITVNAKDKAGNVRELNQNKIIMNEYVTNDCRDTFGNSCDIFDLGGLDISAPIIFTLPQFSENLDQIIKWSVFSRSHYDHSIGGFDSSTTRNIKIYRNNELCLDTGDLRVWRRDDVGRIIDDECLPTGKLPEEDVTYTVVSEDYNGNVAEKKLDFGSGKLPFLDLVSSLHEEGFQQMKDSGASIEMLRLVDNNYLRSVSNCPGRYKIEDIKEIPLFEMYTKCLLNSTKYVVESFGVSCSVENNHETRNIVDHYLLESNLFKFVVGSKSLVTHTQDILSLCGYFNHLENDWVDNNRDHIIYVN
ncbi:hypothetical protein HN385_05695 [archaeon]|nr:hypothetical protein [archaeon]MBT3451461.1 hypothetical protein [archaeon]MBT6868545.1 hypothetical protein [archaeon]MBT7193079.1 hypothetical protein [archaeon]MBT7381168.1 hypothetical protein [archaeon]